MKPTILVTGGMGYIGSHTAVSLLERDYDVVIVDNLYNSKEETGQSIKELAKRDFVFYKLDIRDTKALGEIFKKEKIKGVVHFAGLKAVGESCEIPLAYYDNNIGGLVSLLKVMEEWGCNKIIFSSSATVYGLNSTPPYDENAPLAATSPYGNTKLMAEGIIRDVSQARKDFSAGLLRYFNPVGAHKSGLLGESPKGIPNNLMPYVAQVAAGVLKELRVYGDDYATPDGTGIRDYIHVCDLAHGHVLALDYAFKNSGVQAVNLGTGKGTSVLEMVSAFEKASNRHIPYRIVSRRPGDVAKCYANTKKAEELYGFKANKTIDEMCADGWRYVKAQYGILD